MSLPWMMQLSLHGASSRSSLRKAAGDLLRETHHELQEESGIDPGRLSLISIGPVGEAEVIGEFGGEESPSVSPSRIHELVFRLSDVQGERLIEVGVLKTATGLDPSLYIQDVQSSEEGPDARIPSHGRRFGRLLLLLHLYREACLLETVNRVRVELRAESNPHNIRRFDELREILGRFSERIVDLLGRRNVLCYLRRAYLPYETADGHWRKREAGYAIYLPPMALLSATRREWERFWDHSGELLEADGVDEDSERAPGHSEYHRYDFPLLVEEATDGDTVEQEGIKRRRFYGALAFFSRNPYGYLESEQALLQGLSEDLALLVRDCVIQHHLSLHDRLLFDLNLIDSVGEVLESSVNWFIDLYCPTEIAILRLVDNHLSLVYSHGINPIRVPPLDILTKPGGVLRAARERKIDYIAKTEGNPDYLPVNNETRSQIAVPLYSGEVLMGVLFLGFPVFDAIGPADRLLILALSFRLAAALWRAEKARASSAVAHKLKEILPTLLDNLQALAVEEKGSARAGRILNNSIESIKFWEPRIKQLVSAIYQDISRGEPFDLGDLIKKLVYTAYAVREDRDFISVELIINPGEIYLIRGREQSIEMAIDALIENAFEAMSDIGGNIIIEVSEEIVARDERPEKKFVVVRVEDGGPGVPSETGRQIFEPLFSTKEGKGGGRGLGLFIARGVFEGAGGTLRLVTSSERGGKPGAAFEVRLPISMPDVADA